MYPVVINFFYSVGFRCHLVTNTPQTVDFTGFERVTTLSVSIVTRCHPCHPLQLSKTPRKPLILLGLSKLCYESTW